MKIKNILLWPKNKEKQIRNIEFQLEKINVITGKSQTGKSALIPIIDYCLGSSKCAIPVGMIRKKTDWFGVILELDNTQLLLARREPRAQEQTSDMYIKESKKINIPKQINCNTNVSAVKEKLNELFGLTNLDFLSTGNEDFKIPFKSRPSFRDMSAFEFQPQHIIANPYTLFFKADTYEHQEKLKTIFPLVLGAINSDSIALKHELRSLENELKKKKKERDNIKTIIENWKSDIQASYSMAKELGFLSEYPYANNEWTLSEYIYYLRKVPEEIKELKLPVLELGITDRVVKELTELNLEEKEISRLLELNRFKLSKLYKLNKSVTTYEEQLEFQSDRLYGVGWFEKKINSQNECPFCNSRQDSALKEMECLQEASKKLKMDTTNIQESSNILDKEIASFRNMITHLENELNMIRKHRKFLESKSSTAKEERQTIKEIYRFVGKLEQSIYTWEQVQADSDLNNEIMKLEDKIRKINAEIDLSSEKQNMNKYLKDISDYIFKYAEKIGVERPEDTPELDIKNLNIKIRSSHNSRKDYLWEIGSGANWMGYHISTLLALHEHFISLNKNYVPQFLVLDQPSQVYFPESWPEDQDFGLKDENKISFNDDDIKRVNKIFKTLSYFLEETGKKVQIIMIEHADEITWNNVDNVHLVERWRNNKALIPKEWMED